MKPVSSRIVLSVGLIAFSVLAFGCSKGSSSPAVVQTITSTGSNVQAISVNTGPDPQFGYIDGAFTSVTVCVPSTATCQTIPDVLIDTGSSGLRILSSALSVALPQQTDSNSNPIAECYDFADGITWGPVQTADVKIAGEEASALPIQVIGSSSFATVPADCSSQGVPEDDLADLGANGLLGIGQLIQDCGVDCTESGAPSEGLYYTCPSSGCTDTTEAVALQVQNPVASFATDNNGVIVELPAVAVGAPEATLSGSLVFGIGTQSNNALGGATVFGTDQYGDFGTVYKSTEYPSFLDSGSNAIYFLDTAATGVPLCTGELNFWYCPSSTANFSVVNEALAGTNGAAAPATFTVGNATVLTNNNDAAINGLGGPFSSPLLFDFGLPFFFGRNVYIGIVGKSSTGPYVAY